MLLSNGAGRIDGQLFYGVQRQRVLLAVPVQERQWEGKICRSHPSTTGNRHGEKNIAVLICTPHR